MIFIRPRDVEQRSAAVSTVIVGGGTSMSLMQINDVTDAKEDDGAYAQPHEHHNELQVQRVKSGDYGDTTDIGADDGATSISKAKMDSDALGEQADKRLRLESTANATSQDAGEPGTTGEVHREQTAGSDEDSCMLEVSDDGQDAGELVRVISDEQAAADLEVIRGMWELAAVYEFMAQFKYWLNFSQLYPLQDLEEAIVKSSGPGILAQLHVDLLKGIATKSHVGLENWVSTLAARLISEAAAMQQQPKQLPFRPVRGKEAAEYAQLGAVQRVLTLKALADMRADREDMRIMLDDIMRLQTMEKPANNDSTPPPTLPARRSARGAAPAGPPTLTPEDLRGRQPLGVDSSGCAYYWFDMPYDHDAPVGLLGSRLYVEGPPQTPSKDQLEQVKQNEAEKGKKQNEAMTDKPPLPPNRISGGGAAVMHRVSGLGVDHQYVAVSVANSRQGSPEAEGSKQLTTYQCQQPQEQQQQWQQTLEAAEEGEQAAVHEPATEEQADRPAAGTADHGVDDEMVVIKPEAQVCAEHLSAAQEDAAARAEGGGTAANADRSAAANTENQPSSAIADSRLHSAVASQAPAPAGIEAGEGGTVVDQQEVMVGKKAHSATTPAACAEESEAAAVEPSEVPGCKPGRGRAKSSKAATQPGSAAVIAASTGRPSRKAAAEASVKMAQQLAPSSNARPVSAEVTADIRATPSNKRKRDSINKADIASVCGGGGGDDGQAAKTIKVQPSSAASQQQDTVTDAALAAEIAANSGRSRPTRRAAADASAKIAAQSLNQPIYKLVEEASRSAAATKPGKLKSDTDRRVKDKDSSNKPAEQQPRSVSAGANYVLPPDHVAGSWRLASDSVEGLESLAAELLGRSADDDVALGRLLQEQVVATLLERKEREEKYARARSRVAKSLGLDSVVVDAGRPRRERKSVKYDYDDFDTKMKTAIRAQQKGGGDLEVEDFYPVLRNPAAAPDYEVEVRRGRSGGAAEQVMTLDDIEKLRKRKLEIEKLRAAGLLPPEEEERLRQEEEQEQQQLLWKQQQQEQQQRQQQEEEQARAAQHQKQKKNSTSAAAQQQQKADGLGPESQQAVADGGGKGSRKRNLSAGNAPRAKLEQQRKQPAAKPKPPIAPPAPSAWQLAAAAAAAAAAESNAGSGRPRRRAAAGVHAAVAAAAAAAGGREEDFLGMAAHMQDEYEAHIGAEHVGRGYGAEGYGLPARGHFHSSSTHSMTGLAQQQEVPRVGAQRQQPQAPALMLESQPRDTGALAEVQLQQPGNAAAEHSVMPRSDKVLQVPAAVALPAPVSNNSTMAYNSAQAAAAPDSGPQPAVVPGCASLSSGGDMAQPAAAAAVASDPVDAAALAAAAGVGSGHLAHQLPAQQPAAAQQMPLQHFQQQRQPADALPCVPGVAVDRNTTLHHLSNIQQHVLPILEGVPIPVVGHGPQQHWQQNPPHEDIVQQQQQQQHMAGHPVQQANLLGQTSLLM